ncbi:accessory Sec system translocase SecA2 [Corynebacterium kroppenstedtii]|uniref:accessory Sec system translocase SecA2 n=1 Tax=Corynebacterium sp. PCR 32 TaxID=3351342 RepID=UPI0030A2913C
MPIWFRKLTGSRRKSTADISHATELRDWTATLDATELRDSFDTALRGNDNGTLFAILREASARTIGLTPFDCQLRGAYELLNGKVIQMATGEGKTLVGALAAIIYARRGQKTHCITVNSYLAGRDAHWMRPLFAFFDVTVGAIHEHMTSDERRKTYTNDVVFGSINEIGFDLLRDHLITRRQDQVQTSPDVAIVDEADSVMVDEALVPLVLAGNAPGHAPTGRISEIVRQLTKDEDYAIDDDQRNVFLTDKGAHIVERRLGIASLYDPENIGTTLVQVNVALHAKELLIRDVHYIVRDGKVALVDNSKGRIADLQRWPDGLQSAVEAKEGLDVTDGGRVLDTITIQALLGRYTTLCGMTGTATAAAEQLRPFYGLDVAIIEPNVPCIRDDEPDRIFTTDDGRRRALVEHIQHLQQVGRPVLVGTHNVAESEGIEHALHAIGVDCVVLNAKNDQKEARIIADAGLPGRVTVSTQMAGRGTDIKLGGSDEKHRDDVVRAGGLAVVGYGRHRSVRLDDQLRGRAGRQGDPGSSVFFVSLEDDVVAIGGAGESITAAPDNNGQITQKKAYSFIDHCQRVTEGQMLQIHANTWKYNKLINDQRVIIDERRRNILDTDQALNELQRRTYRELTVPYDTQVQAARDVELFHLDEHWARHLEYLDDIRESIHLRALARENPVDEFHRMSIAAFKRLASAAVDDASETWRQAKIDNSGVDLGERGLRRPSSTWTYMVNDNPLSGNHGSVVGSVINMFR